MKEEFICKTSTAIEWQKWLNQWRHNYNIEVISMSSTNDTTTILLKRTEK